MNTGWISLHRKISDHWTYEDKPFNKSMAWIDILLECNHIDQKVNIKNTLILCKRGESLNCLNTWGKRWGWDKSKVRRFLKLLKSDTMVVLIPTPNTTHLRVINYDTYQLSCNTDETQVKRKRNASETQLTLNNNDNNENKRDCTHPIQKYVFDELPNVSRLKIQLTEKNCITLLEKYPKQIIKEVLEDMDNHKPLNKKYVDVYRTCNSWCKIRIERNGNQPGSKSKNTGEVDQSLVTML